MLKGHSLFVALLDDRPFRIETDGLLVRVDSYVYEKIPPSPLPWLPVDELMEEYGDVVWVVRYCVVLSHIDHALQRYTMTKEMSSSIRPSDNPTHLQVKFEFPPTTIFVPEDFLLLKAILESWPKSQWTLDGSIMRIAVTLPAHTIPFD
jgi:hypothetical protein